VLDHADDGYFVLDESDRIVYTNPCARRFIESFDNDAQQPGEDFIEAMQRRFQCEPATAWQQWALRPNSGEEPLFLIQPQKVSSPPLWLQVSILDQQSGGHSQRVVRVQDISAQMETQQATWAFQSMVRHKLNTPMHGMASCLDLLASQPAAEVDPQELDELIGWTQEAMVRLEKSVASVLRHTQAPELVQSGDSFSLCQLPELLQSLASSLDIMPVSLDVPESLKTSCMSISQSALECVIVELFENAKKFHPRHDPRITVEVNVAELPNREEGLRLIVCDDGIHLSPTQLEKMWIPYYQGERSFTGEVPGMGLGLSLVRSLIWQLGGNCTAVNRADSDGIIIEVVLPISQLVPA
jgi:K+-sensing histidine kinase KdpD